MNRTAQDARDRMDGARAGSLADPSLDYLYTLRSEIHDWLETVSKEICIQEKKKWASQSRAK